jgi:hypothetical protein
VKASEEKMPRGSIGWRSHLSIARKAAKPTTQSTAAIWMSDEFQPFERISVSR